MSNKISNKSLFELKNKLDLFPPRSSKRKELIKTIADFYDISPTTVYKYLRKIKKPRSLRRSDTGIPRKINQTELERYCEIIAAMKIRTRNKKNHHLSTREAIRLLEEHGIETPDGFVKPPKSLLNKTTVNRYLKKWGYRLNDLSVQPTSVRFQATYSNECWQFDLSHSDLNKIDEWPDWIDSKKGRPIIMLYSVVDDRSGAAYQEYHIVYGEDVEAALSFLYRAMSPKQVEGFPLQGIPKMIYMDNGPIAKSQIFKRVTQYLGIEVRCHMAKGKDGRRVTARSKGKVERPFKTVKNVHETLYHFHKPKNVKEANEWLLNYLLNYNDQQHRSENHSRIEDWVKKLPPSGIQKICSWELFCKFAREPEERKVGPDAKITVNAVSYQLDHELADQTVTLWWGMFDNELFVECEDQKFGPYKPDSGPIPLNQFRSFKKSNAEKRADRVESLAKEISLPLSALTTRSIARDSLIRTLPIDIKFTDFHDPDPFQELNFTNINSAKRYISSYLGIPLGKLDSNDVEFIDNILEKTLQKDKVIEMVRDYFKSTNKKVVHGGA